MSWPDDEVTVGPELVAELLAEQHPDLAHLPLVHLDAGFDNVLWRLGADLVVRLPRRSLAVGLVENEQRWLPELAPRLPLPVPAPVRIGRPSASYPWPWSIVPWLAGKPGDRAPLTEPSDAARRLAEFLAALHHEAPASAPHNTWRAVPLGARADSFEERMAALGGRIDMAALGGRIDTTGVAGRLDAAARIRELWEAALSAPVHSGAPLWVHGDLHPANVLVAGGTLAAVIDFGDLSAGDPANDLAAAWMLLPDEARDEFWARYPSRDAGLVARSIGWALLLGLMLLEIGLSGRPNYERVARVTLGRLVATNFS